MNKSNQIKSKPVRTFELLGHKTLAQIRTPTPTLPAVTRDIFKQEAI